MSVFFALLDDLFTAMLGTERHPYQVDERGLAYARLPCNYQAFAVEFDVYEFEFLYPFSFYPYDFHFYLLLFSWLSIR